jgi:carbonic anhydrase
VAGNDRFMAAVPQSCRDSAARRAQSAGRHAPSAAVLACSDARVTPELVFDQGVSELFSVRVAGKVAARAAVASLEYAVDDLGVELVVVLGHERCGAVTAAVEHAHHGAPLRGELGAVGNPILPAVHAAVGVPGDRVHHAVVANVAATVAHLRSLASPLGTRIREGSVDVLGAVYDLETGRVRFLDDECPASVSPHTTTDRVGIPTS